MSQLDRDVAYYVLAYLARQGYSHTMSAFLQECTCLPSNTAMMVLPETPLSTVIAEHKARKENDLLLGKLGPQTSWDVLWEKLQHYLSQLRTLSNTLLESQSDHPSLKKSTERKKQCRMRTSQKQFGSSSVATSVPMLPNNMCNLLTNRSPSLHSSSTNPPLPASSSPRKRRDPVQLQPRCDSLVPPALPPAVPAPQQLLDTLLEDESLQHHLAHLINSSLLSDGAAELTDNALDHILAMTSPDLLPVTMITLVPTKDQPSSSSIDNGPPPKKQCPEEEVELPSSTASHQTTDSTEHL